MPNLSELLKDLSVPFRFKQSWLILQKQTEDFFSSSASDGNFSSDWLPAEEAIRFLIEEVKFKKGIQLKVLDIGCGGLVKTNYHRLLLENFDCDLYGVDPYIGESGHAYNFKRAIAESLPFRDNEFDLVTVISALDHSIHPYYALLEIHRVCKPNGFILFCETIRDRNRLYYRWRFKSFFGLLPSRFNQFHNWAWTENSLKSAILKHFEFVQKSKSSQEPSEMFLIARKKVR